MTSRHSGSVKVISVSSSLARCTFSAARLAVSMRSKLPSFHRLPGPSGTVTVRN
jgi:hypothetical protein